MGVTTRLHSAAWCPPPPSPQTLSAAFVCLPQCKSIAEAEWNFLLRAGVLVKAEDEANCPVAWLDPKKWGLLCALERYALHPQTLCRAGVVSGLCSVARGGGGAGMHWKEETPPPPLQGAQPMPSRCPPDGKCQAQ